MRTAGLIVAAGRGQRLGGATPKQYLAARRRHACSAAPSRALLAHPGVDLRPGRDPPRRPRRSTTRAVAGIADPRLRPPVAGGADPRRTRCCAGLEALAPAAPDRVLIHDAARPFVRAGG